MIEILIDIMILSFLAVAIFEAYSLSMKSATFQKSKGTAAAIANQKMEEIRALPYDDVGVKNAIPSGIIDAEVSVSVPNEGNYSVKTSVIYVDDPADGKAIPKEGDSYNPGDPETYLIPEGSDTRPYDYKKVIISVYKEGSDKKLSELVSDFASKVAETESGTGAFSICVLDSFGNPVPNAKIEIKLVDSKYHTQGMLLEEGLDVEDETGCLFKPNLQVIKSDDPDEEILEEYFYQIKAYVQDGEDKYSIHTRYLNVIAQQLSRYNINIDAYRKLKINAKYLSNNSSIPDLQMELHGIIDGDSLPFTKSRNSDSEGSVIFTANDYLPLASYYIGSSILLADNKTLYPVYFSIPEKWDKFTWKQFNQSRGSENYSSLEVDVYFSDNTMLPRGIKLLNTQSKKLQLASATLYGINLDTIESVILENTNNGSRFVATYSEPKYIADDPPNGYGSLFCLFNLSNAEVGSYDIIISNQNGEIKLRNYFQINE